MYAEQIKYLVDNGKLPDASVTLEAVKIGPKKTEDVKVNISTKKDEEVKEEKSFLDTPPDDIDYK